MWIVWLSTTFVRRSYLRIFLSVTRKATYTYKRKRGIIQRETIILFSLSEWSRRGIRKIVRRWDRPESPARAARKRITKEPPTLLRTRPTLTMFVIGDVRHAECTHYIITRYYPLHTSLYRVYRILCRLYVRRKTVGLLCPFHSFFLPFLWSVGRWWNWLGTITTLAAPARTWIEINPRVASAGISNCIVNNAFRKLRI